MQQTECIFCKIIENKIPAQKVFENSQMMIFKDLHPQASKHYLAIHREHTANISQLTKSSPEQLVVIFSGIAEFTEKEGIDRSGFRIVTNQGPDAGQTVFHTHFHILGGEPLKGFGR